jgi:hypothetical protein
VDRQRPNDCVSIEDLAEALDAFGTRYSALVKPFTWCFTRKDLERRLRDHQLQPQTSQPPAAIPDPAFPELTTKRKTVRRLERCAL